MTDGLIYPETLLTLLTSYLERLCGASDMPVQTTAQRSGHFKGFVRMDRGHGLGSQNRGALSDTQKDPNSPSSGLLTLVQGPVGIINATPTPISP